MPGVDADIVQHHIPTYPHIKPVKQKLRKLKLKKALNVKEEVSKQINVGFLKIVEYPDWLANIVNVPKKDSSVRMYADYWVLNKASPKDDFPLPRINILVDSIAR